MRGTALAYAMISSVDVIFSAPFSGALYRWFAQCLAVKGHSVSPGIFEETQGYYHHAFTGADEIKDVAIASLVMFDGVYLGAGDFAAPDAMREHHKMGGLVRRSFSSDLGVTIGMNALHDAYRFLGDADDIHSLASLPEVANALKDVPAPEHAMELAGAVADALLVGEYARPLICGSTRRGVLNALISAGVINQGMLYRDPSPLAGLRNDPVMQGKHYGATLNNYVELRSIRFNRPTLELVGAVKDNKDVRSSAESFQTLLSGPSAPETGEELRERLELAASRNKYIRSVGKIIEYGAYGLAVVSVVPGMLPAVGAASLMGPVARLGTRAADQRESWFQFDTKINSVAYAAERE
jgi:hypothetical protein